jgi:hypothetical protein
MQKRIACLTLFFFLITAAGFAQMGGGKPGPAQPSPPPAIWAEAILSRRIIPVPA